MNRPVGWGFTPPCRPGVERNRRWRGEPRATIARPTEPTRSLEREHGGVNPALRDARLAEQRSRRVGGSRRHAEVHPPAGGEWWVNPPVPGGTTHPTGAELLKGDQDHSGSVLLCLAPHKGRSKTQFQRRSLTEHQADPPESTRGRANRLCLYRGGAAQLVCNCILRSEWKTRQIQPFFRCRAREVSQHCNYDHTNQNQADTSSHEARTIPAHRQREPFVKSMHRLAPPIEQGTSGNPKNHYRNVPEEQE